MEERTYYDPPRLAAWMLGWLLRDPRDTPLGDFEEFYNELAAEQGETRARWWYRGQVLRLLPGQLVDKIYWGMIMLKSYFLLGVRTLRKNKVASAINIAGLSAAIGIAVVIFLFLQEINTFDDFHKNGDRIYLVGHTVEREGAQQLWGTSPVPLGPALAADFPQIERAVRFTDQSALVRSSGSTFQETVSFADAGFFEMLTFPLRQGQAAALTDPSAVILSAEVATKYFGDEDPMGQALEITFENGSVESLIVRGVAEAFPHRSSLTFDLLVGYEKRLSAGLASLEDWAAFTDGTFIQLRHADALPFIADQLDRYVRAQNEASPSWQTHSFFLDNIRHPDLIKAWDIHDRALSAPPIWESVGFGLVGVLVLLISCFNYITISLGSATRRMKEIGIRKTSGAARRELVLQFLTENLLLCFAALLGGLVMAGTILLPFMYRLTNMSLRLDLTGNLGLWGFMAGLLAFIGLVSGAYPAFYISSFQPAEILRGKMKLAPKRGLIRTLTTVQFVLTIMTICISIFLVSLDNMLAGKDWGYAEDQVLVIPALNQEQQAWVRSDVVQLPHVAQVAGTEHHVGASTTLVSVDVEGIKKQAFYYGVGPSYLAAMGMRVVAGRAFGEDFGADGSASVVINQTFARQQGWDDPIGEPLRIEDHAYSVVGVVEDFLVYPLAGEAQPVVFGLSDATRHNVLVLRIQNGSPDQVAASVRTIWERHFPGVSFAYYPQTDVFEEVDLILRLSLQFTRYLGLFALFISCMGLFGMASQRAVQRLKEVGIRKAMGASALHVVFLVNRGFLVMLAISTLIATPLCYAGLSALLSLAPIDIPLGAAPFVLSNALVFLLAAASLSLQTTRLVRVNPADVLRYE